MYVTSFTKRIDKIDKNYNICNVFTQDGKFTREQLFDIIHKIVPICNEKMLNCRDSEIYKDRYLIEFNNYSGSSNSIKIEVLVNQPMKEIIKDSFEKYAEDNTLNIILKEKNELLRQGKFEKVIDEDYWKIRKRYLIQQEMALSREFMDDNLQYL